MRFTINDEDAFYARRDELVNDFGHWLGEVESQAGGPGDFELLLDWKFGYDNGELGRWSCADLSEFLLYWCPRKLSAQPDLVADLPRNVGRAMEFLAARGLLEGNTPSTELAGYASSLREHFQTQMSDPGNFGLAKSLFAGVDLGNATNLTSEVVDQAMADFNALPEAERRAITDPALQGMAAQPVHLGPIQLPEPDALAASTERAPLLAAFDSLADYFAAPGKPLTKTGAIKIADASALAELLQTGDKYEEAIGEHVFRKQSARDFGGVDLLLWWAREVGVLRPVRGKLVAVKAWQRRRRSEPAQELVKAADVLFRAGPIAARGTRLYMAHHQMLDEMAPSLASTLMVHEKLEFDVLAAGASAMLTEEGVAEPYPGAFDAALDRGLAMFERCGLITQSGVSSEAGRFTERRVGGIVEVTPAGVWIIANVLKQYGFIAELVPPASEQTAAGLIEQAGDLDDLDRWWGMVSAWLDNQRDPAAALTELLDRLHADGLAGLILILSQAPQTEEDRLAQRLLELARQEGPPQDSLPRIASSWLLERGLLGEEGFDRDTASLPPLLTWGALCALGHGQTIVESFAADFEQSDQHEFIAQAGRLLPPLVLDLLDAWGKYHPDKRMAKAARKELFRARSKLVNPGR